MLSNMRMHSHVYGNFNIVSMTQMKYRKFLCNHNKGVRLDTAAIVINTRLENSVIIMENFIILR